MPSMRRASRLPVLVLALLLAAVGCGAMSASSGAGASGTGLLVDWPTYHRTTARSGLVAAGPTLPLSPAWTRTTVGAVYGEPLVVGSILIVATEQNYVYGLDARTGDQVWRTRLGTPQPLSGLPCGNIDPLGITGTPAYDARTGSLFVVAETTGGHHTLWALDVTSGSHRWSRSLDTQTRRNRLAEQQRGAVLVTGTKVITAFGGLAGDCDNYVGYVTSAPTSGTGPVYSYAVPTTREGGIWATPGPVRGADGHVYVSTGNGEQTTGTWDTSDSVTELSAGVLGPLSVFGPSTWQDDNAQDLDLGSMSPAMVPAVDRIVIAGKRGTVYLLPSSGFGGVGASLAELGTCKAFGGSAVSGRTVLLPCRGSNSIHALTVGASTLTWSWNRTGVFGAPVIAGTLVYTADQLTGDLVVFRLTDGVVVERHHAGSLPHFPSQVVSGDYVFVPTLGGITAFRGS